MLSDTTPDGSDAGRLALRLDSPLMKALNGLRRFRGSSVPPNEPSDNALIERLLGYAVNWNTRARTAIIAQYVLHWVLTSIAPEELLTWPNIKRTVESLLPYTGE